MAKHRLPAVGDTVRVKGYPVAFIRMEGTAEGWTVPMAMIESPGQPGYAQALTLSQYDEGFTAQQNFLQGLS